MPSSPTTRNRLEKQGTGENLNTWGAKLNTTAIDLVDAAMDGRTTFTLSTTKTLTSTNYAADEARMRFLDITGGTGGTVTIPAVEKLYLVRNGTTGDVIITTGSGTTATVKAGNTVWVASDATNVYQALAFDYGSTLVKSSAVPASGSDLVNKTYADNLSFSSVLPSQSGNSGKYLQTDGTAATWQAITGFVATTGAESIGGVKTFTNGIIINSQTLDGLTAVGVALVEAADAAAQRTALGLGTMAVETASSYLLKAGGVSTGLHTFNAGISINSNTLDGLTAAGVTLIEAADAAAQRTALGLGEVATQADVFPLLSSTTISVATAYVQQEVTGLNMVLISANGLSHNDATDRSFDALVSSDGTTFTYSLNLTLAIAAAATSSFGALLLITDDAVVSMSGGLTPQVRADLTARCTHIRIQPQAGSLDAGTLKIYGVA